MADVISDTIARVRELDAAATKGPWEHGSAMCCPDMGWVVGPRGEVCPTYEGTKRTHTLDANDAELIAYYRTAAPALADECARLRERVRVLEEALRPFRDTHFMGCRRYGFGGEPHHDHDWSNGREPATACSDHCWAARAALKGSDG